MLKLNLFQRTAMEIAKQAALRRTPEVQIVPSLDGIDARPLSYFSAEFRTLLLELICCGEADFVICDDRLYILRGTIDPYLPGGVDWDDLP